MVGHYVKKKEISDFIPQEWLDITLPLDANENRITRFDTDDSYWHWLVDYLYETDIPLPESQRLYLEKHTDKDFKYILWRMAYESFGTHALENVYDGCGGIEPFAKLNEMQLKCYEAGVEQAEDDEDKLPAKEDYLFTRAEYERLQYEFNEYAKTSYLEQTNDMPYRAILAHFLKQIPDHAERYSQLKYFDDECEKQAWDFYK